MYKRVLVILSFITLAGIAGAQEYRIQDKVEADYQLKITNRNTEDHQFTNTLLQEIAYRNSISFKDLDVLLKYSLQIEIVQSPDRKAEIIFKLKQTSVSEDTHIKNIDIKKYLFPSTCIFECVIKKKNSDFIYDQLFGRLQLTDKKTSVKTSLPDHFDKDDFEIDFSNIAFYYSESDLTAFKQMLTQIDYCRISAYLADKLLEEYKDWRPDLDEDALMSFFKILEYQRFLEVLEGFDFENNLRLHEHDPFDYTDKLQELQNLGRRLQTLFNDRGKIDIIGLPDAIHLADMQIRLYDQYREFLKDYAGDTEFYVNHFLSIDYSNTFFTKLYQRFLKHFDGVSIEYLEIRFAEVIHEFLNLHIKFADQCIQNKQFVRAEIQIANVEKVAVLTDNHFQDRIKQLKTKAIFGTYNSYLDVAEKAMKVPKADMVILYLHKAEEFQKLHPDIIPDKSAVYRFYDELGGLILAEAKILREQNKLVEAGFYLTELTKISKYKQDRELASGLQNELNVLYEMGEKRINELNYYRYSMLDKDAAEDMHNEVLMLRGNQKSILNNLDMLKY